ncbi:hypothetical protein M569_11569 [Genlisea aurea]|uniref:Pentatricopeptide repeat-containing protein n=1 Tax=Genlisea aurea TaxID=192259 RepID=S8DTS1_9LAMI|nr:hypothetical protein M569_11569 [Genlisea aurea]
MAATAGSSSSVIPDASSLRSRNFPSPNFSSSEALLCLHRCTSFNQMKQIHGRIIRSGLQQHQNQLIVARLIRLCSSFGKLDYAYLVLERIEDPTSFSWNLLIRAHTENGRPVKAVLLYNLMIRRGVDADKFTFPFAMKACLASGFVEKARELYGFAVKRGMWRDVYLNNLLMAVYFKYGALDDALKVFDKMPRHNKTAVSWTTAIAGLLRRGRVDHARKLFDEMPRRNVVSFTAMINGYARSEKPERAFELFARMQREDVTPNEYTLVGLAMSCSRLGILELGHRVHEYATGNGFEIGPFLGTALIDMYSKCGSPDHAKRVFEGMEERSSAATWNAMITSLGIHGNGEEALSLFEEMERTTNIEPDAFTLTGVLAACLQTNNVEKGIKYFYHMINRYGIEPVPEHYTYLSRFQSESR